MLNNDERGKVHKDIVDPVVSAAKAMASTGRSRDESVPKFPAGFQCYPDPQQGRGQNTQEVKPAFESLNMKKSG